MAKDLGTQIVSFLLEQSASSGARMSAADLAVHFKESKSDVQDVLMLLELEGLVSEVSSSVGGPSTYMVTEMGTAYAARASQGR